MISLEEKHSVVEEESLLSGIVNILKYYDLTPTQIHVYLSLAKNGPTKVRDVSKNLEMHRTETYKILKELESLGLVAGSMERPIRYTALSLRSTIRMLWEERKNAMDAVKMMSAALVEEWEQRPRRRNPVEEAKAPPIFTVFSSNTTSRYRSKIKYLNQTSSTRLYYLEQLARGHLEQCLTGEAADNYRHPEVGSFIVFDDAVFLINIDQCEKWVVTEIRVPEIIAAYTHLYRLLEAEP